MAQNTEELIIQIQADLSDMRKEMNNATSLFRNTASVGESSFSRIGSSIGRVTGLVTGLIGAVGGVGVAMSGLSYNAQLEQAAISFETLLGSAEASKKMIEDLQEFGATTPFEFMGLQKSAKMLKAFGFETEEILPTMELLGDAVSAVGGSEQDLQDLAKTLGQMQAKGKIMAEDVYQFADRGIDVYGLLAKETGKSKREIMEMGNEGKLLADKYLPLLTKAIDENPAFNGAMEKQSKTFTGLMSTLKDEIGMFMGEITKPLFNMIKSLLPDAIKLVKSLSDTFTKGGWEGVFKEIFPPSVIHTITMVSSKFKELVTTFTNQGSTLSEKMGPVFETLKNFFNMIKDVVVQFAPIFMDNFIFIFGKIQEIAIPLITKAVEFIREIMAQFVTFWNKNGDSIIKATKKAFKMIHNIINFIMPAIKVIIDLVWESIKNIIQGATNVIIGIVKVFSGLFNGEWSKMWEGVKQLLSGAIALVIEFFKIGFIKKLGGLLSRFGSRFVGKVKSIWDEMVQNTTRKFNAIVRLIRMRFNRLIKNALTWGKNLLNRFIGGIDNKTGGLFSKITGIIRGFTGKFTQLPARFLGFGYDIMNGLLRGISRMAGTIYRKATEIGSRFANKVKSFFGIASPSKLMTGYGVNIGEGLVVGIDKEKKNIEKQAEEMGEKVKNPFKDISTDINVNKPDFNSAIKGAKMASSFAMKHSRKETYNVELSFKGGVEKIADEVEARITKKLSSNIGGNL